MPRAGQAWRAPSLQPWGSRAVAEVLPKLDCRSPFTPKNHFPRVPMSNEDTHSQVVGTFCRQEPEQGLTLLCTDPLSPHSHSV